MNPYFLLQGLLSLLLFLGAHFAVAFVLLRWGRKHFGTK